MANTRSTDGTERYHLLVSREEADQKISTGLETGRGLLNETDTVANHDQLKDLDQRHQNWKMRAKELLIRLFSTHHLRDELDVGGVIGSLNPTSLQQDVEYLRNYISRGLNRLEGIRERLDLIDSPVDEGVAGSSPAAVQLDETRVFVVHGHDELARETVARTIERLGLVAVILNEQANEGKTIIEKFEAHSAPGFAVIVMTPDDFGSKLGEDLKPRARQNVILELGFFMGKLGRNRTLALVNGEVEIPSDISGVVYERMDDAGNWKLRLGKELRAAGISVDLNSLVE